MIGNYVQAKSPEKTEYESPVMLNDAYFHMLIESKVDVLPIPITEKWLTKLGYEDNFNGWSAWWYNVKADIMLTVFNDGVCWGVPPKSINDGHQTPFVILYVHDLQNVTNAGIKGRELSEKQFSL